MNADSHYRSPFGKLKKEKKEKRSLALGNLIIFERSQKIARRRRSSIDWRFIRDHAKNQRDVDQRVARV
jgi:type II restriction/modification system DNA methylase subunit YeeA